MKDFHHNYICRPTENAKKEQKPTRSHHCNMCKCVKLHYHDCPMVMHPCPLHGSPFQSEENIEKFDRGQNLIISFHPSSRTERLLQPIKSLLANCKSETKINFQYYSPPNSISSESVRPNYGQNALEQLKRNLNNNIIIDRTKSFVVDKSTKVKKLKECFYSPCGSVTRKSRSQTSIKDKLNQALFDDHKETQNALFKIMSELPPNDLRNDWFCPRKLSNEKFQSDFITVTKHDKNNIINHKIFEIKHEAEADEIPYVGFPKPQNQFVYTAASISEPPPKPKKKFQFCKRKKTKEAGTGPDIPSQEGVRDSVSQKSIEIESSSSGSVYVAPFFFVPRGVDNSEGSGCSDISRSHSRNEKGVQADDSFNCKSSAKTTQTREKQSEVNFNKKHCTHCEPDVKSVILQTKSYSPVSSRQTSGARERGPKTKIEDSYVERVSNFMKPSDYSPSRQSAPMSSRTSKQSTQNTSAAEDGLQCKEISINARWGCGMKDQTSQTEELWHFQLSLKTFESKTKSQGTSPRHSERGLQTVYHMTSSHDRSEFINIKNPHTSVKDQYPDSDDSDKVEKIWMGKSHSDSNLVEKEKSEMRTETDKTDKTDKERKSAAKEQKAETQERSKDKEGGEKSSAPVSDLSELKSYIRELFEKENLTQKKCVCEKPRIKSPPVSYKSIQTSNSLKEPVSDVGIQTLRSIAFEKTQSAGVQTSADKKKNGETQTDISVFLEEPEEDSGLPKKIKLCRTVVLNPEDESKTFFICTVCGREITVISRNAATSTVDLRSAPFVKPPHKTIVNENVVSKWTETHLEIKKLRKPSRVLQNVSETSQNEKEKATATSQSEREKVSSKSKHEKEKVSSKSKHEKEKVSSTSQNEKEKASSTSQNEKEKMSSTSQHEKEKVKEKPSKTSKAHRSQKGASHSTRNGKENNEKNDLSAKDSNTSATGRSVMVTVDGKTHTFPLSSSDCECDCNHKAGSSEGKSHSKSRHEHSNAAKQSSGKNKKASKGNQFTEYFYPVITSRMWPKEFLQNWETIETCTRSSHNSEDSDSRLQLTKQKRSYEKDCDTTSLGKRIKVDIDDKVSFGSPLPTVSGILVKGEDGAYKFWPSSFVECPDFQSKEDILDENEVEDSISTLQLDDIVQDDLPESTRTSDDITSRSSFLTETEEQELEVTADDSNASSIRNRPTVMPQSHSVFNFSSFPNARVSSNSKPSNSFSFIGESKKKSERF